MQKSLEQLEKSSSLDEGLIQQKVVEKLRTLIFQSYLTNAIYWRVAVAIIPSEWKGHTARTNWSYDSFTDAWRHKYFFASVLHYISNNLMMSFSFQTPAQESITAKLRTSHRPKYVPENVMEREDKGWVKKESWKGGLKEKTRLPVLEGWRINWFFIKIIKPVNLFLRIYRKNFSI